MASQAKKKVFHQNKNEYTYTHILLASQWSGMQFVALQSGREESLPSIGRGKMEEHRKEREQKERGMFTELYQGKQKNRGDSKVNESSGNWFWE